MSSTNRCPRSRGYRATKAALWLVIVALLIATPVCGYYFYLLGDWDSYQPVPVQETNGDYFEVFPGIHLPPARPASEAGLDDSAEIIGVFVMGHARAYAIENMGFPPSRHIVNDRIGDRAVSVTFCDRLLCSRVFTAETAEETLDLNVGGWKQGKGMILNLAGVNYAQKTGENLSNANDAALPYLEWPHVRTTWGAWRTIHPETDVYVGNSFDG